MRRHLSLGGDLNRDDRAGRVSWPRCNKTYSTSALLASRKLAIHCRACQTHLYTYRKGGKGQLVKCFVDKIVEDHARGTQCPNCGSEFGRVTRIKNRLAHKIIGGKIFTRSG